MWRNHLHTARRALEAHVGRSALTVTSVTIGVLAIVVMSSLARGGLRTLMTGMEELGAARMLLVASKIPERQRVRAGGAVRGFDRTDKDALTRGLPHVETTSLLAATGSKDVVADNGRSLRADFVAADVGFFQVFHMQVAIGRAFRDEEDVAGADTCLVGPKLARRAWQGQALGRSLYVDGQRCRVIGVFADNARFGMNFGFDWDDFVLVPHRSAAARAPQLTEKSQIVVITDSPTSNEVVKRIVNQRLVATRGPIDDFTLYDLSGVVEKFESTFALMQVLVGLVAAIALLIGGVGVMNMMLVSVSERTAEIGVRKALGANRRTIALQFLVEATLLCALGGAVGVAVGVGLTWLAGLGIRAALPSWQGGVSISAVTVALLSSTAAGVIFGALPALRAARLSPMEALRT